MLRRSNRSIAHHRVLAASVAAAISAATTTAVATTAAGTATAATTAAAATAATARTATAATEATAARPATARSATARATTTVAATAGATTATAAEPAATARRTSAATATAKATRTLFAWACLIDHEGAAVNGLAVHAVDARLSLCVRTHFHKAEALGTAGVTVHHHLGRCDGAELCECLLEIFVANAVCEIADVKFIAHVGAPFFLQ